MQIIARRHWADVRRSQQSKIAGEQTLRLLALRSERKASRHHPQGASQPSSEDGTHNSCKVWQHCRALGQTGSNTALEGSGRVVAVSRALGGSVKHS